MAASDRPGGLTALSVLNGFFALAVGGTTIQRFMTSYDLMEVAEGEVRGRGWRRRYLKSLLDEGLTPMVLQILALIGLVATLLLLVSIWGLLKRSNLIGRWLGTLGGVAPTWTSIDSNGKVTISATDNSLVGTHTLEYVANLHRTATSVVK